MEEMTPKQSDLNDDLNDTLQTSQTEKVDENGQGLLFDIPSFTKKRVENANRKHLAIKARFKVLYHGQRVRRDDVILMLSKEFFLSTLTIERILLK